MSRRPPASSPLSRLRRRARTPAQARGRARARARHAGALRHRLRQRRLLDLLRARPHRRLRARADAARLRDRGRRCSPRRRRPTPRARRAIPEAGGSASFARHAFDELVSFVAALGADARLHRHRRRLGVLRPALPLDLLGAAAHEPLGHRRRRDRDRRPRRAQRRRRPGGGEALDHARGRRLRDAGAARDRRLRARLQPRDRSSSNVHWGVAPTWSNLAVAIPVAMLAYTGVETVSNLAEEARDPVRTVPNAYKLVAGAVFAIYFTLPLVALSALPVERIDGELTTLLALPPEEGGYANDPILGVVQNLGLDEGSLLDAAGDLRRRPRRDDPLHRDERGRDRRVADHVLDGELPAAAGGVPAAASALQDAVALARRLRRDRADPRDPPGRRQLRRDALLARRDALVHRRARVDRRACGCGCAPTPSVPYRARPNLRVGGVDWPLFAIVGGIATGRLVPRPRRPEPAHALGRASAGSRSGSSGYVVYRRRVRPVPLRETVKAPPAFGAALALEYRRLLVPVVAGPAVGRRDGRRLQPRRRARRADRRAQRARGAARPAARPTSSRSSSERRTASSTRRSRSATRTASACSTASSARTPPGPAIVEEADARNAEIIVLGSPRRAPDGERRRAVFGKTVDYVLKHAPCRVMVAAVGDAHEGVLAGRSLRLLGRLRRDRRSRCSSRRRPKAAASSASSSAALFVALGVGRLTLEREAARGP